MNIQPVLTKSKIRNTEFNNRLTLAPMSRASATDEGVPTTNMAEYYANFAKGGFGLLIAEGAFTDDVYAQSYSNQPGMVTDAQQAAWANLVRAVKTQEGKIILQLIHAGALSQHVDTPCGPSAIKPAGKMLQGYGHKQGEYDVPTVLTIDEISDIKAGFVQAAERAEAAGFDGVEIHCANGYLLDQFLTKETNTREDQYGGSLSNRIRLTSEILKAVRARTDFIVGVRLSQGKANNPDYFWPNGTEDAAIIFNSVAEAGADYIHLASDAKGYVYHSHTKDKQSLTEFARNLTGLPIIANGGLQDLNLANDIIGSFKADFVAIGKTALVNHDLPQKIAASEDWRKFDYSSFKYGVTIEGQQQWEKEG